MAIKAYQKRTTQIQERRFFPERIRWKEVLVTDMIDDYLKRNESRLRWFDHYMRHGGFWRAAPSDKTLRQIVPADIETYVAKRIKEAAPATVNRELAFLKHLFNVAIADGKADGNLVRAVNLFKENNERMRYLSDDEEHRLRENAGRARMAWWRLRCKPRASH